MAFFFCRKAEKFAAERNFSAEILFTGGKIVIHSVVNLPKYSVFLLSRWVNNLCTTFYCEKRDFSYAVFSSLKELKRPVNPVKRFRDNPR